MLDMKEGGSAEGEDRRADIRVGYDIDSKGI